MDTEAKVLSFKDGIAVVEVERKSACSGNCSECSGCNNKVMQIDAYSKIALKPGDQVLIASDPKAVLFGLFIVFIIPLLLPIVAYFLAAKSGFGLILAIIAVVIAFVIIWLLSKSTWYLRKTQPRVIRVIREKR